MLGLNQMKKFMYLAIFLVSLSFSSSAWSNAEVSGHFGMKFGSELNFKEVIAENHLTDWSNQKNMPFHFGADVLYRHMLNETGSFGAGVRYRFAFTGERDFDHTATVMNENDKYKFAHHRLALLLNYRFHFDQFFVGLVVGLDIWKNLNLDYMGGSEGSDRTTEFSSSQFLWNQITGQAGLELGYKVTDNLLVKLEAGYDLSRFSDLKCKTGLGDNDLVDCEDNSAAAPNPLRRTVNGDNAETEKLKLDGFYTTLGIGWFFG